LGDNADEIRFKNIEDDIEELKETVKIHSSDIVELKQNQAETRIYVKQIFERIDDLKVLFKSGNSDNNKIWSKIVIELIKAISIVGGIIAAIKIIG